MSKKNIFAGLLLLVISLTAYSQVVLVDGGEDGPKFSLTGTTTGMFTMGFVEDGQIVGGLKSNLGAIINPAPGMFYGVQQGKVGPGINGYYVMTDFRLMFNPVSSVELYLKFLAHYRPGSPYLPLQLEELNAKTFSDLSLDVAYGRVNAVKGLGFSDFPLDIWLKAGKYDTLPSQFNRFARHSSERATVMGSLRTKNEYSFQLEASYPVPMTKAVSVGITTNMKLNDAIGVISDEDGTIEGTSTPTWHGDQNLLNEKAADIPIHLTIKMEEFALPFGALSAEFIYAYNAMHIFSGDNFGFDLGLQVPITENILIPVGLGVALYGKNIDPLAATSLDSTPSYIDMYDQNGYQYNSTIQKSWDSNTVSLRDVMRLGVETGVKYDITPDISASMNVSFIYSWTSHYYRGSLNLPSITADLRASYQNRYFIGGGIFLGTLADAEWKTKEGVDPDIDRNGYHKFNVVENMGFEVFGGLQMSKARFILGYNVNKGLSMNNYIEAIPEAQIKYRQKDSVADDGLFERGGFFTKLIISY